MLPNSYIGDILKKKGLSVADGRGRKITILRHHKTPWRLLKKSATTIRHSRDLTTLKVRELKAFYSCPLSYPMKYIHRENQTILSLQKTEGVKGPEGHKGQNKSGKWVHDS